MYIKLMAALLIALSASTFAAETVIEIAPLKKVAPQHYKRAVVTEKVSLSGRLETVPMGGAMLTLQSTSFGQVVLFSPFSVPDKTQEQLEQIQERQTSVTVTGTMLTLCSASELRRPDVVGCREIDLTQPIFIKPW